MMTQKVGEHKNKVGEHKNTPRSLCGAPLIGCKCKSEYNVADAKILSQLQAEQNNHRSNRIESTGTMKPASKQI